LAKAAQRIEGYPMVDHDDDVVRLVASVPDGMENRSHLPTITQALVATNYTNSKIEKLLG
jgi:hypothetical protein